MNYKPLPDRVKTGYHPYKPDFQGHRYCWEASRVYCSTPSLEDFIRTFRDFNITSDQLDNFGTEKPLPTNEIPGDKFERMLRILTRPTIFVVKLIPKKGKPLRKLDPSFNVPLDSPYAVKIGEDPKTYKLELSQVPFFLNELGCRKDDLTILQEKPFKQYSPIDPMEKLYILYSLEN